MAADDEKIAELSAIIQAVRDRVRARYPQAGDGAPAHGEGGIQIPIADLMPVVHARDAAQAKIAAIGSVNPRAGGPLNQLIQFVKRSIARSLQWFVRDQVTFNRETISAIEALIEALNEHNRILVSLAAQTNERLAAMQPLPGQMDDMRKHWTGWTAEWERKLAANEIQFLRNTADLQGAFQHRVTQIESSFRDMVKSQHANYLGALDRATMDIQKRLWDDLEKIRSDYERLIHQELRLVRQRAFLAQPPAAMPPAAAAQPGLASSFDYARFAERFRGSEAHVRQGQEFYKPFFAGCTNVLDIGCGRGEFLEGMREQGIPARGIDLDEESVALCRHKGLAAEKADLFEYLASQPDGEFDGIFSAQVVEHIAPERLPEMMRLCAASLRRGGVLAIETPNPECLAIFATHFYLDPTHTRPVPHPLLAFCMEEAGFGSIEVHRLSPAVESMPEVAELPPNFRKKFFGELDYTIIARRL
ncbi:MAG TPA: class I SAM-dependent methyltransferase [Bryobacteraceae bacterium]|nr:class I SAM-dependent methyltransferase [Bryobacteraceae bacterium]